MSYIERTLVLLKPDAVQRGIIGEIISRFEKAGLKIVGMKMVWVDEEFAKNHYLESDIAARLGEDIWKALLKGISEGPVVAIALEGVEAVEVVRKMVGPTEPKKAMPGTIRGDYSHVSIGLANSKGIHLKNVIHASANKEDAERELRVWFSDSELHSYRTVHDIHTMG